MDKKCQTATRVTNKIFHMEAKEEESNELITMPAVTERPI